MRYCIFLSILFTSFQIHSQVLRGTVKNDKGGKLEGAVIFIQGGRQAALSEKGGVYELKGLNEKIYVYKTKCGLPIYMWVNEKVSSMYAALSVKYGSVHTKFKIGKKVYEVHYYRWLTQLKKQLN